MYVCTPAPFPAIFSPARDRDVTSGDDVINDVTIRLLGNDVYMVTSQYIGNDDIYIRVGHDGC